MPIAPAFGAIRGMQTDPPIDQMPNNVVRRIVDFLPEFQFVTQARGAWTNLTGTVVATAGRKYVWATYCPFASGTKIVLSQQNVDLAWVSVLNGATVGTAISGLGTIPRSPPVFHLTPTGGLLIIPTSGAVVKYSGTAGSIDGVLRGNPPSARLAASWGDYLILANSVANPNRLWFSPVGNPDPDPAIIPVVNWNTGANGSFVDFPEAILNVTPKGNTIFVFTESSVHLLVGDLPPPAGNMTQRKYAMAEGIGKGVSGYGTEATVTYKDFVIWANASGVYKSDGGQPIDLTKLGGIKSYWPFLYHPQPLLQTVSIGIYRNYLVVSILDSAKAFYRCVVYDLENNTWWEWSNIPASQLVHLPTGAFESDLMLVDWANNKLGSLAAVFDAGNDYTDGNVVAKTPAILTGMHRFGSYGQKRVRRAFISCIVQDGNNLQAGFTTPDRVPASGSDPASAVSPALQVTITGTPSNANKNLRVPYHIDRRAEMVQAYLVGYGGVGVSGLDMEVAAYDQVRDGDAR